MYLEFSFKISSPESEEHILENKKGTVKFTSRWMLHQLKLYLTSHIEHKCMHKKFGTVLYSKGVDILTSLSWALGAGTLPKDLEYMASKPEQTILRDDVILKKTGYIINNLVHSELSTLSNSKHPEKFNFDDEIGKINPTLWCFFESITRTVRETAKEYR